MKELLLYIAKQLVDQPEAVTVAQREDGDNTVLELRVAPEDMGKVRVEHFNCISIQYLLSRYTSYHEVLFLSRG